MARTRRRLAAAGIVALVLSPLALSAHAAPATPGEDAVPVTSPGPGNSGGSSDTGTPPRQGDDLLPPVTVDPSPESDVAEPDIDPAPEAEPPARAEPRDSESSPAAPSTPHPSSPRESATTKPKQDESSTSATPGPGEKTSDAPPNHDAADRPAPDTPGSVSTLDPSRPAAGERIGPSDPRTLTVPSGGASSEADAGPDGSDGATADPASVHGDGWSGGVSSAIDRARNAAAPLAVGGALLMAAGVVLLVRRGSV